MEQDFAAVAEVRYRQRNSSHKPKRSHRLSRSKRPSSSLFNRSNPRSKCPSSNPSNHSHNLYISSQSNR